ncbi:MAG: chemotaxis protein CheW [bacterium]|nr:chemotaxis protein CheW [bacterium]
MPSEETQSAGANDQEQYLVFHLKRQPYGVPILCVKEILQYSPVTVVPRTPDYLAGVINLRGSVVPVIDLGCLLDARPSEITKRSCIVIVEAQVQSEAAAASASNEAPPVALEAGLIVDLVDQVIDLPPGEIESKPAVGIGERARFILGMGRYGEGFAILLDLDVILGPEEIQIVATQAQDLQGLVPVDRKEIT